MAPKGCAIAEKTPKTDILVKSHLVYKAKDFKKGLNFTILCSNRTGKLSKLQATKESYDRGSHFKGLFE